MNIRIGTKLAITVGIGVVLVAGMIVNQQLSNTSVARQTELARDEQFVIADLLSASVDLQKSRRISSGRVIGSSPGFHFFKACHSERSEESLFAHSPITERFFGLNRPSE